MYTLMQFWLLFTPELFAVVALVIGILIAVVALISATEKVKVANKAGGDTFGGAE